MIATATPGLKAYVQWDPDTVAGLIIETGWPAIVLPWLAAMWFGWLDLRSRQPSPPPTAPNPSNSGTMIEQQAVGDITAENLELHIHQEARAASGETSPPPAPPSGPFADSKLLRHAAGKLIGRARELGGLTRAWNSPHTHIVSLVASGGVGKTALVAEWVNRLARGGWEGVKEYFDWSFYSQGTRGEGEDADQSASADVFIARALKHFGDPDPQTVSPADRGARLAELVAGRRALLVLDGIEPLQHEPSLTAAGPGCTRRHWLTSTSIVSCGARATTDTTV